MKICSKCGLEKFLEEFPNDKKRKDGKHPSCKLCAKAYRDNNREALLAKKKIYYRENKEIMIERNHSKYLKHKEKHTKTQREYYNCPENWAKRLLWRSKDRASKEGLEHNIEIEDIVIPKICPYLGCILTFELGNGQISTNASLDRIDSSKGYLKGNVQVISRKANTMKSDATNEELIRFAKGILEGTTLEKYAEQFRALQA